MGIVVQLRRHRNLQIACNHHQPLFQMLHFSNMQTAPKKTAYRQIVGSRMHTRNCRSIRRISQIIQCLSERIGLVRIFGNTFAIMVASFLIITCLISSPVMELIKKLIGYLYNARKVVPTCGRAFSTRDNMVSVYLINPSIKMSDMRISIQNFIKRNESLKWTCKRIMADWFQLWNDDSAINEIKVANHLIELPATWKHRLANESTVHEYASQVSGEALPANAPPWRIFVIQLTDSKTCIVTKCHQSLSALMADFVKSQAVNFERDQQQRRDSSGAMINHLKASPASANNDDAIKVHGRRSLICKSGVDGVVVSAVIDYCKWQSSRCVFHLLDMVMGAICEPRILQRLAMFKCWASNAAFRLNALAVLLRKIWADFLSQLRRRTVKRARSPCQVGLRDGLNVAWTLAIPQDFVRIVCQAASADSVQVLLAAFGQAVSEHLKHQTGNVPEFLHLHLPWPSTGVPPINQPTSDVGGVAVAVVVLDMFKCQLRLPMFAEDSRVILASIQQQMAKFNQKRFHAAAAAHWLDRFARCTTKWPIAQFLRNLTDARADAVVDAVQKNNANQIQSAFRWTIPDNETQLRISISTDESHVQMGLLSTQLSTQKLSSIVDHLERHIYQLAASYGVQQRRLSRYSIVSHAQRPISEIP